VSGVKKVTATVYKGYVCVYVEDGLVQRVAVGRYSKILFEVGRVEVDFIGGGRTLIELGDIRVWFVKSYDDFLDKCIGVEHLAKKKPEGG